VTVYFQSGKLRSADLNRPKLMKTVVIRYRGRGTSGTWREINLTLEPNETRVDRINRFEDENFGMVEVVPVEPSVRLVHPRKS
jgi:hypothetical protein